MPKFTRALTAMAFVALGAVAIGGRSIGQDGAVQKTSADAGAGTRPRLPSAVVGVIDMDAVFKAYTKVEFIRQEIEAEATARKADLNKIQADAQQLAKQMEQLTPGTPDFKNHDDRLTKLQAEFAAAREKAQRDFAQKEAEALATIYKEIQAMVESVAKHNHMNYVLRVSNEAVSGADPQSALAAMSRSVVWSDGSSDITEMVVKLLNQQYQSSGSGRPAAAPATKASAPQQPAQQPNRSAANTPNTKQR
jgi:outer membrane protein